MIVHGWSAGVRMLRARRYRRAALAAVIAGLAAPGAWATEPAWPTLSYDYIALDEDVRDVLTEFGNHMRIPVKLSDRVRGRVRGGIMPAAPRTYLDDLCGRFGLSWYYDGTTLHISSSDEQRTEIVEYGSASPEELLKALRELGVADARYPVRLAQGRSVLSISGPPVYRALVRQTLASLMKGGTPEARVRVFRAGAESSS
ncbi:type III secretion protein [Chelatococcus daeguensis]|uniref:SPI-1 type 3 secretion system secretin N0 domain-containing protein n=1 Tax=Chelatococcus sambhunathii TaxID=363953 RepID=A0ABM9U703_9HYPH|nr:MULTISPECIES: hypothetical protein [Chelatococcus]KZE28257.1 hypothetical protein AVW15_09160 [Chelatococcus daeguensis]MBM3084381.1 type III secretion protein [Chelatococcus daeguensis]CUA89390.1 hypothetical protein Ga0061061_10815 [Chelatococcus sambhunathii]